MTKFERSDKPTKFSIQDHPTFNWYVATFAGVEGVAKGRFDGDRMVLETTDPGPLRKIIDAFRCNWPLLGQDIAEIELSHYFRLQQSNSPNN